MNVGLPGAGLGGLFVILCAILTTPIEIVRAIRGKSSRRRMRQAFQTTLVALCMAAALSVTFLLVRLVLEPGASERAGKHSSVPPHHELPALLPIAPVLVTLALLVVVLALAASHLVVHRLRHRET
jgi:sterol desaturase/sphingolipid hydroxylase (fatty acid hydroxylase superfamily)